MRQLLLAFALAALAALLPTTALAQPPVSAFYGRATAGGKDIPVNTTIAAFIDGVLVASTETKPYLGQSVYDLYVPGTADWEGKTVLFRIGGVEVKQRGTWQAGVSANLDLTMESELPLTGENALPALGLVLAAAGGLGLALGLLLRRYSLMRA